MHHYARSWNFNLNVYSAGQLSSSCHSTHNCLQHIHTQTEHGSTDHNNLAFTQNQALV